MKPYVDLLERIKAILDSGTPLFASTVDLEEEPKAWLQKELQLLTLKPVLYLFNLDEEKLTDENTQSELQKLVAPAPALFVCAKLEDELRSLDENDRVELLDSYGVHESGLVQLIRSAYATLGLQSYLTAGDKEVRAWTIPLGATAPQAAGVIHGDFERGFIAADIVNYYDLISAGSLPAARAAGKLRTEGKTYIMQPDDVVEFKFNVSK
jgi:ribosome-binding ATPase YchF (GTP1/OBG family)